MPVTAYLPSTAALAVRCALGAQPWVASVLSKIHRKHIVPSPPIPFPRQTCFFSNPSVHLIGLLQRLTPSCEPVALPLAQATLPTDISDTFDHVSFEQLLKDDSWIDLVDWDNIPFLAAQPAARGPSAGEALPDHQTDLALANGIVR